MFKIDRKIEYSLIILRYFKSLNGNTLVSANEISQKYSIPFDMASSVMRLLAKSSILGSKHGLKGGYYLQSLPESYSLLELSKAILGNIAIVNCLKKTPNCNLEKKCNIKNSVNLLKIKFLEMCKDTLVKDLIKE